MGFLGNLVGNVLGGIVGKAASSAMDLKSSKELILAQLEANKQLFEFENSNKHQFEVGDLKAAGLNPILSAMNPSAIGVGGVSAPNWTSDDDVYGPASAKAMQAEQLKINDSMAKSSLINAEANMLKSRSGASAVQVDNQIKLMKADAELANIIEDTRNKSASVRLAAGKFEEAMSMVHYNKAAAINKLEDTVGRKLSNREEQMFVDLLDDPNIKGTATYHALILAKNLNLPTAERIGLVAAITGHRFRGKAEKNEMNDKANSGKSVDPVDSALSKYIVDQQTYHY